MSQTDTIFNDSLDYFTDTPDLDLFVYNFTSNGSFVALTTEERDLWREIPLGIILTLLCLLTTVGNAMVLHAVRTERRLQSVSAQHIGRNYSRKYISYSQDLKGYHLTMRTMAFRFDIVKRLL